MNNRYHQISWFHYRSENSRHLSEQNSNFGYARSITTPTDLYIDLCGTKITETIDTAAVLCCFIQSYKTTPKMLPQ